MTKEAILARLRAMASTPGATEQQQKDAATAVSYAKGLGFDNSRFTDEDSQMQAHSLVAFWVAEGKTGELSTRASW